MEQPTKKTKKTFVSVESDIYEEFVEYVKNKYGKTHTVLGQEISNAMRFYLDNIDFDHTAAHSTPKRKSGISSTNQQERKISKTTDNDYLYGESVGNNNGKNKSPFYKTMSGIFDTMINGYGMTEDSTIHSEAVKKIIKNIAGGDERTIKKYFKESSKYLTDNGEFEFTLNFEKLQADDII